MAAGVLKTIVIVLAVLIFASFGLIIWRIFGLVATDPAASFGDHSLALPADCRITGVAAVNDRLAVLTDGPSCNAVHIMDPETGQAVGRVTP